MKMSHLLASALLLGFVSTLAAQPENMPTRAYLRIGTPKLRHGSRIVALAYSPDGAMLVAGGGADPVRIWNPKTGELIRELPEHNVTCITFTESGRTVLCAGYQKTIRLFDTQNNKETGRLEGHKSAIKSIAVAPDTTMVASGSQDGSVYLWEWNSKRKYAELPGHTAEVLAVLFSPDRESNLLVTAGADGTIIFWDIEHNKMRHKVDAGAAVYALAFTPDGKTLFSAGDDHLIRRWDVATAKSTGVFKGHADIVTTLFFHEGTLVSGSLDRTVRFWDAKTTEQRRAIPRSAGDCDALALTRVGDFLAMAGVGNTVRIYDSANGKEVIQATGPTAALTSLTLAGATPRLVSLAADGSLLVWNPDDGKLLRSWDSKQGSELLLAASTDGKTLATAGKTVRLWNPETGDQIAELPTQLSEPAVALAFSPDGKRLALGHHSGQIEMWDLAVRKATGALQYQGFLHALAWAPDGKKLAAAGASKIFLWDPDTGNLIRSFEGKEGPPPASPLVASLLFASDSRTLAAGCFDGVIRIYDTTAKTPADPRVLRVCEGHLAAVYGLAFSPDGRLLVSGSFDRTARLWEAFSGKQVTTLKGHIGPVMGAAFMPDGRSAFTAATDTVVYRWDVPGLSGRGQLADVKFNAQDLEAAWETLASEDIPRGHDAMWRCVANGPGTIAHVLKEKKLYLLDPDLVKKLFKNLNSPVFQVRQAAMDELMKKKYGRWMEGRYDEAIANPPSLEYKRRVEMLKEKLNEHNALPLVQERMRLRRFMLICEQLGGPEALEALQQLADRGPEEDLRDEARESLRRLAAKK